MDLFQQGKLQPTARAGSVDATDIKRILQGIEPEKCNSMNIVRMPQDVSMLPGRPKAQTLSLDPDAAYLIIGGFGGLGKALTTCLVEKGAQMLLVLSPSDSKASGAEDVIAEVEDTGCMVLEVIGEVQYADDVKRAIGLADRSIKGVIHLAESAKVWLKNSTPHSHADCYSERSIPRYDL